MHDAAGGTGTYADPISIAVGHSIGGGQHILDWPAGTIFWIEQLGRYFVVEDTCGDGPDPQNRPCHTGYPREAVTWLDAWIGGENRSDDEADECAGAITGVVDAVLNPDPYRLAPGVVPGPVTDYCATVQHP